MLEPAASQRARFGPFELDLRSGELTSNGRRQTLPEQPLALLKALLERPGELVTRDELRHQLWPGDTFVDFEHGLNAAVKRLREVLDDSADTPRFVETVPRRGYRFIAPVSMEEFADALTQKGGATDHQIGRDETGYYVTHGRLTIHVGFGRIEDSEYGDDSLIALPANEFFDDECIHDSRSSLGAYMQHHFAGRIPEVQALVAAQIRHHKKTEVEKEQGVLASSYGVGATAYLDCPLASPARIVLVAVTTKRAGEGLHANARGIFDSIDTIHRVMADRRLTRLDIPIIGSGHGGLPSELALLCMLISLADIYRQPAGRKIRSVNIIAYRRDEKSLSSISLASIRRALSMVNDLFAL